jgi:uncharacterized membrane protein
MFLSKLQINKQTLSVGILAILHIVGLCGIFSSQSGFFLKLSALNLLVTFLLVFYSHSDWNLKFVLSSLSVFILTFLLEVVGVKTGIIFGIYSYGENLGFKLWQVPLLIGLNWLLLLYCVSCLTAKLQINFFVKSLLGAFLMVILDLLMEPIVAKLGFWSWQDSVAPLKNYIAWFVISFLLLVSRVLKPPENNMVAKFLYFIQLVFFALLNIVLHYKGA